MTRKFCVPENSLLTQSQRVESRQLLNLSQNWIVAYLLNLLTTVHFQALSQ